MPQPAKILDRYQCGPFRFADDDYYDRHLVFDHVDSRREGQRRVNASRRWQARFAIS